MLRSNQINRSPFSLTLFSKLTLPSAIVLAIASNAAWVIAMRTTQDAVHERAAGVRPLAPSRPLGARGAGRVGLISIPAVPGFIVKLLACERHPQPVPRKLYLPLPEAHCKALLQAQQ
jgi:hypothetical protein